jgi:hypothetical protein
MGSGLARRVVLGVATSAALVAALATPAAGAAAVTDPVETWVPDGEVKAVAVSGSTAYIGGNFSRIAPYTGASALFNAANGEVKKPWPEVNGVVNAVERDGSGGWFLGGEFRSVGGVPRTDLAHVLADGSVDPNWAPETNGLVRALAVENPAGPVYAGGDFSTANGEARAHVAGFTRASGALTSFTGSVAEDDAFTDFKGAHALLLTGQTLYVGGIFDQAAGSSGGGARKNAAAFNVVSSAVLPWDPAPTNTVTSFALAGAELFVGGRFGTIGGQSRSGVAKVDPATGAALGSWIPPIQCCASVSALAVSGTQLYFGGSNIRFNPMAPARNAAAISVTGAVPNPTWTPTVPAGVLSLVAAGSTIYLGGGLFSDGPQPTLIGVDATNGAPTAFAPALGRGKQQFPSGGTTGVRAIGVNGSDVVAGGTFTNVGGVDRRNLGAIDLNTGQATGFNPPMKGMFSPLASVSAVAVTSDGVVWAGGQYITEGPNERTGLAAFDATSGALTSFHRDPNNAAVSALVASGSTVFAGGSFTSVGGTPRRNVAAFRHVPGEQGTVLPFDVDVDGPVHALALAGDTLYLGGQFTEINGALAALARDRRNLAAVDATNGLARDWDPDADNVVRTLAIDGDTAYAGGDFAAVNRGLPRERLAAFDRQSGAARGWDPGADGPVRSLATYGPTVFAGGDFTRAGGVLRSGIAALDGQTGAPDVFGPALDTEERGGPLPPVTRVGALFASPATGLLTAGSFVMNSPTPRSANLSLFGLAPVPAPAPPGGGPGADTPGGPGGPGGTGTVTPGDGIDPNLGLAASRRRFRVGRGATSADGTATAAGRTRRRRTPAGTTLTLSMTEPARVKFEVLVKGKGRRSGKKCVKQTRRNRKRKRCTLLTLKKPVFIRSAAAGRSRVAWSGRLGRKALKPGAYVLRATPTDAAGNTGKARQISITIVR